MRKVIYTCITGKYDQLRQPLQITPNWEYLCFTNNQDLINKEIDGVYKIIPIIERDIIDPVRLSRRQKILAFGVQNADILIWHDGNMQVNCNLDEFTEKYLKDADLALSVHNERNDLFDEINTCIKLGKDEDYILEAQKKFYFQQNIKSPTGLYATGVLVRRNYLKGNFYFNWWRQVGRFSRRDQIALAYCLQVYDKPKINTFTYKEMLKNFPKIKHQPNNYGGKY